MSDNNTAIIPQEIMDKIKEIGTPFSIKGGDDYNEFLINEGFKAAYQLRNQEVDELQRDKVYWYMEAKAKDAECEKWKNVVRDENNLDELNEQLQSALTKANETIKVLRERNAELEWECHKVSQQAKSANERIAELEKIKR